MLNTEILVTHKHEIKTKLMVNSCFIDCIHFLFAILTNYHKFRCLKQELIISQFCKTEIQIHGGSIFLHKVKVTVLEGQSFFLKSGDEFTSKFIRVVGQVQLYSIEGQMSLFSYWLSARGHHAPGSPWLSLPLSQSQ